jgi:hypothetical protein
VARWLEAGSATYTAFVESTVDQVISKRMVEEATKFVNFILQELADVPKPSVARCLTMNLRRYSADGIRGSAQQLDPVGIAQARRGSGYLSHENASDR